MFTSGFPNCLADGFNDDLDRLNSVVIAGDWVIHQFRVTVGINQCHNGDSQLTGLSNGVMLTFDVYYKHCIGGAIHVADTSQVLQ